MSEPLEPKEVQIDFPEGEKKTFILSTFSAIEGREIITQYPISGLPKLGDYATNEKMMLKIMAYVSAVSKDGTPIPLITRALVDNHAGNWESLAKIEWAMMEYNCSFFREGKVSSFLDDMLEKLPESISLILIPLLEQLSQKNTPHSTS